MMQQLHHRTAPERPTVYFSICLENSP